MIEIVKPVRRLEVPQFDKITEDAYVAELLSREGVKKRPDLGEALAVVARELFRCAHSDGRAAPYERVIAIAGDVSRAAGHDSADFPTGPVDMVSFIVLVACGRAAAANGRTPSPAQQFAMDAAH